MPLLVLWEVTDRNVVIAIMQFRRLQLNDKGHAMAISISSYLSSSLPATSAMPRAATVAASDEADAPAVATDKVTLGGQVAEQAAYTDPRGGVSQARPDLQSLLEESNRKAQEVIDLIMPLIKQQGLNLAKVVSGEQHLTADPATIEKAKAAIADDGEFGVQQVAERILSFAKAAIGDDPTKLAAIRAAVEKGFKEAADILGGTLPEISQKTHSAIMAEFDRWESDGIPSGDKVSLSSGKPADIQE